MKITKELAAILNEKLSVAIKEIADKHNLTVGHSKVSYAPATMTYKVDLGDKQKTNGVNPKFYMDLQKHGYDYNLKTNIIGKKIKIPDSNADFVIMGMKGSKKVVLQDVKKPSTEKFVIIDANYVSKKVMNNELY